MKIKSELPTFFIRPLKNLCKMATASLRLELIFVFVSSFIISIAVGIFCNTALNSLKVKIQAKTHIEYAYGIKAIQATARKTADELSILYSSNSSLSTIQRIINELYETSHLKVAITDSNGNVILDSQGSSFGSTNLFNIINNSNGNSLNEKENMYSSTDAGSLMKKEIYEYYPVSLKSKKGFLIVSGIPQGVIVYGHSGNGLFSISAGIISFILLFLLFTRKKMKYIEEISKGLIEISKGNLDYRVPRKGKDELSVLSTNINYMASQVNSRIKKERSAEKAKNELITNVSHDLRTPLTSVMGYLGLVKNKKYENEEQMEEYLNIAYAKSEKLKILIEDLFEYTKLTNESIKLHKECVALNEFIEQLLEEMVPIFEENNLKAIKEISKEKLIVDVDINKILRVFENLIMNAVKYSYKPSNITIKLYRETSYAVVAVENLGEHIDSMELEKIFERFYRIEKSRSTCTGGSGLGLAIARGIVELHGGEISAKCDGELISFIVKLETI